MRLQKNNACLKEQVTVLAPAKINLTLDITGKRENGYHDVEMVMQTISLYDTVTISVTWGERRPQGIKISCSLPVLPADETNLAHRAAALFYEYTGLSQETTCIHIEKRIPIAAGLAGGSSDAAAVLRGLNQLHESNLSYEELCEIGLKIGADVPYCIEGGTVLATGIGETLERISAMVKCFVVLCRPPVAVLTKEIYEAIDAHTNLTHPDTQGMLDALRAQDYRGICKKLGNVMQQVTAQRHPKVLEIRDLLLRHGAGGALMSGSGPTVFGLFLDEGRARTAEKMLRHRFSDVYFSEIV